jgi:hypothetical protein
MRRNAAPRTSGRRVRAAAGLPKVVHGCGDGPSGAWPSQQRLAQRLAPSVRACGHRGCTSLLTSNSGLAASLSSTNSLVYSAAMAGDVHGTVSATAMRTVWGIGAGVVVLVLVLMAWDHLWGNEPGGTHPFPVDPPTFFISMVISLACAGLVFGLVIPRVVHQVSTAPKWGAWLSGLAVPLAVVATWLGFPLVLAGGGVAIGLVARNTGVRSRWATAAIVLGILVLILGWWPQPFRPRLIRIRAAARRGPTCAYLRPERQCRTARPVLLFVGPAAGRDRRAEGGPVLLGGWDLVAPAGRSEKR